MAPRRGRNRNPPPYRGLAHPHLRPSQSRTLHVGTSGSWNARATSHSLTPYGIPFAPSRIRSANRLIISLYLGDTFLLEATIAVKPGRYGANARSFRRNFPDRSSFQERPIPPTVQKERRGRDTYDAESEMNCLGRSCPSIGRWPMR